MQKMFLEKHRIIIMRVGGQYVYGVCSYMYTFVCIKKIKIQNACTDTCTKYIH